MEKPFLTLSSKHWITGIAPSAHAVRGGIFYKAKGISPLNEPGQTESPNNGLLRAGPPAVDMDSGGTVVVDNAISKTKDYPNTNAFLYLGGDAGHLYKVTTGLTVTDLRAGTPITNPSNGLFVFQPVGGTKYMYYIQQGQIGRWDLSGTYPTGWTDNYYNTNITTTTMHPPHRFLDREYFGNGGYVGSVSDDGAAGIVIDAHALDIPANSVVTAISDDGTYLVIAITDNKQFTAGLSNCRILFWDTNSSTWQREYPVADNFIHSLKRNGNGVIFAQGKRGVYQVSFQYGVNKIIGALTGLASTSSTQLSGPDLTDVVNQETLLFAHDSGGNSTYSSIGSYGKLSLEAPTAFLEPLQAATANKQITLIESQFVYPYVISASNNKIYTYLMTGDGANTGVFAQTIYIPLPSRTEVGRLRVTFAEPLATGDDVSFSLYMDEDETAISYGSATFTTDGALIRKNLFQTAYGDEQISLLVTFNGGVPKIKSVEFYGDRTDG